MSAGDEHPIDGATPPITCFTGIARTLSEVVMSKRIAFFAYGCFAYLIFLGTFLYAIAFVGAPRPPTSLDGEPRGSLALSLAIDGALLAIFAVQHSVMARRW